MEGLTWFEPDIIVSDIMLPELDGNAFIRMLRAQGNLIPTIAVSAAVYQHDQQTALESGFNRFLKKPLDPDQIVTTILELLPP